MATSTDLARAVASALGLSEKAVLLHLKHIRAVPGTITFKGHGSSAADMTPLDAARLVIVTAGSAYAANAARTLRRFAGLASTRPGHTAASLEQMLAETIAGVRSGRFRRPGPPGPEHYARPDVLAEACLKLTWPEGEIGDSLPCVATIRRFRSSGGHDTFTFASAELGHRYVDEARLMGALEEVRVTTTRSVSFSALERVAAAL